MNFNVCYSKMTSELTSIAENINWQSILALPSKMVEVFDAKDDSPCVAHFPQSKHWKETLLAEDKNRAGTFYRYVILNQNDECELSPVLHVYNGISEFITSHQSILSEVES